MHNQPFLKAILLNEKMDTQILDEGDAVSKQSTNGAELLYEAAAKLYDFILQLSSYKY